MDLLALFRRDATAPAAESGRGKRARNAATHDQAVQQLRQKARHRLIGAAVLVGIGIVAFPLVFETQPRPVPMDLPIVIPAKESAPPLAVPALGAASLPEAAQRQAELLPQEPEIEQVAPEAPVASAPIGGVARADAALPAEVPSKAAAPASAQPAAGLRFVVQVGAYAEQAAAREARRKLEAKGLKTYAQVAKTKEGERIRVRLGPFTDKAEAERAASKAKALGLGGSVLTL
ncbi:DedD protein [Inhella inkyongensis]|uniref:DedD protein n=1 Tax=Inhella inkyongensis TaxID=392593 RepID=A0A840S799_9BURK|nr:SPOR domain-containing protein [Inhella inkyongensis]MBB5205553.1 DedD protein [Inhella inkyongensis]